MKTRKNKKLTQRILASVLSVVMLLSTCSGAFAFSLSNPLMGWLNWWGNLWNPDWWFGSNKAPTMETIEEIQAYTDETMYGTGVVEVEINYEDGVDLKGLDADSYVLEDRGSLSPDFGEIIIDDVKVKGNVVTLILSDDSYATEDNVLVYTGADAEGSRVRNAFGIYCTGAWYRDENGTIRYGKDDADAYENNTTGMGYQARACLELKLRHADEAAEAAACLADELGQYNEGGLWNETIDRQFGEGKFQNLYDLEIPSSAAPATDGTGDDYVQGYYYIPENYDPANGIVFTIQGQGISYWKLADGCDNAGTGFMYDSATYSWMDKGAIVVNIHDRSSAGKGEYTQYYDFVLDDVNVMKYFIEEYGVTGSIVIQGNSRGTNASSCIIKALAGQEYYRNNSKSNELVKLDKEVYDFEIDTFICNNGTFGGSNYSAEDWDAIAATGLRLWAFDGEQDSNNITNAATYKAALEAYKSDEWIEENIRLTGVASDIFAYWGESDHSMTRINGWYFDDAAYYGPHCYVEDGEIVYTTKLKDGDTYVLDCRGSAATSNKVGYEYKIYDDLFQVWALMIAQADQQIEPSLDGVKSIQAYTDETMYGTGLVEVEITYKGNVDLSGITAESYVLEDRGSLNPDYGQIAIEDVVVKGNKVTLVVSQNTAATEDNKLVYTGADAEGSRVRNALGIYPTGAWYRDENGVIHYGKDDTDAYENNTTGMGYQVRASLELKLRHADETESACLVDEKGQYDASGLWLETIDRQFGEGKFQDLYALQLPSTAAPATDGTGDDYVQGYYYIPENYDPAAGIVFTIQGQGISYWKLADGCDNKGTGFMYDSATDSWKDNGAIVVNIHDRSSAGKGEYSQYYDFVLDDVNVMKYFIEKYGVTGNIVIQGNSRGTMASSAIIKALAGQEYYRNNSSQNELTKLDKEVYNFEIDTFICNNGSLGSGYSEADWAAVAATGMKAWSFDGEQDSNNITSTATYKAALKAAGYSDEWIEENVRLTGVASEIFAYWGESDHSMTRINGWYFDDAAYYGPDCYVDENGEIVYNTKLADGDKYTLKGRGTAATNNKNGYEYTIYDELFQEWALIPAEKVAAAAVDFDSITELAVDRSQAAQLPLTGWFTKTVAEGRTVKVYIAPETSIRDHFTVVAVPDGVDTWEFLEENGWIDLMDARGEGLFVLEPGAEGWGTVEEEAAYINAAIAFLKSPKNANNITVFSTFGEFYLVGYAGGAAPLESWAANNPLFVIGQVYADGEGLSADYLAQFAEKKYNGDYSANNYMVVDIPEELWIPYNEVPVPTWLINYGADSQAYWLAANDCVATEKADAVLGNVYVQRADSDAWQTDYSGPISKVAVLGESKAYTAELTAQMTEFLYAYTRYDNTSAYGNALAPRLDIGFAIVDAQKDAKDGAVKETVYDDYFNTDVEILGEGSVAIEGHGTLYANVIAFIDDGNDGEKDPRQFLVYIPEGFEGQELPILYVNAGGSQTDHIFFDCTSWWKTADEEGIALVFTCETYSSATGVGYKNNPQTYTAIYHFLEQKVDGEWADLDFSRVYSTGQSAGGSGFTNPLASEYPEFFAAVAATSGTPTMSIKETSGPMPAFSLIGQGESESSRKGDLWDDVENSLDSWADFYLTVNGFVKNGEPDVDGYDKHYVNGRQNTYEWINDQGILLVSYGQTQYRAHNCIPEEIPLMWDFLEHYSYEIAEDGTITRYYSESAFEQDDAVVIEFDKAATDYDSIESLDYDYSQAAQQPLTGWFTKTVAEGRTVKVYMSEEASVRTYFTVVAVPDGVNTWSFLENEGWIDVADAKGEALLVLEPGAEGWGTAQEEADYVAAAFAFLSGTTNAHKVPVFSTFGEHYLVGYGKGAAALELWAAAHPILVISQTYVDGVSAGSEALDAAGAAECNPSNLADTLDEVLAQVGIGGRITYNDIPVPTHLINYTGSEVHWLYANDCMEEPVNGAHYQKIDSSAYATDYANGKLKEAGAELGIAKVEICEGDYAADVIYDWMSDYTRYDTTFDYSNAIAYRLDYTSARVAAQQDAKDGVINETLTDGTEIWAQEDLAIEGHGTVQVGVIAFADNSGDGKNDPREYIMYVPEGFEGEELPVLMVYPGNSQTDSIFFDATLWWQIAEEEGIVLMFVCETYSSNPTVVSHANSDIFYNSLVTILEEQVDGEYAEIDFTRIYGTGQSAGSSATQGFAMTNPEFFAAVASTSAAPGVSAAATYQPIPVMMITGQMDNGDMPQGFASTRIKTWADYMLKANGFNVEFADGTYDSVANVGPRHPEVYTWSHTIGDVEVPLVSWAMCLLRPHNCYPSDMPILWDYMKHYSMDEEGNRYYSPSAFEEEDAVEIVIENRYGTLDTALNMVVLSDEPDGSDLTEEEYARWLNPMENHCTGFFLLDSSISSKMGDLKATVYIPEGAEQGNQAMLILPESGVDNYIDFIIDKGWKDIADQEKCYVIALHNPNESGQWGGYDEAEQSIASFISGVSGASAYFLVMNHCMYLVGYGDAATLAQQYAMEYPTKVSGLATFGDVNVSESYMAEAGSIEYKVSGNNGDINQTTNKEIAMNVWMSVADQNAAGNIAVADYWKAANAYTTEETLDNELVADVTVVVNGSEQQAAEELLGVQRYIGYTLSNMRSYAKAEDLGCDVRYAVADVGTGGEHKYMNVQYYVYVPETLDANEEGNAPVVMIFHGGTGNGDEFMARSGWHKVADQEGCIVVSVSKMYAPKEADGDYAKSESNMAYSVLQSVLADYPADESRVYAYGFSGGGQLTWHLMTSEYAELFAAMAPRSGMPKSNVAQEKKLLDTTSEIYSSPIADYVVPVWLIAGQYESEYYDTNEKFNAYGDYIRNRNGVADVEGVTEYYNYVGDYAYTEAVTYYNDQGMPMFRTSITADIGHSIACSEAMTAYTEFLKYWSRDVETGELHYNKPSDDPTGVATRADVVTMLWEAEGKPVVEGGKVFSDVAADAEYADAIAWASANKVVNGYSNGTFRPDIEITREQAAVILYNYAKYKGEDITARADLSNVTDLTASSDWALAQLKWAVAEGVLAVEDGKLDAKGGVTCAEMVQMLEAL